MNSLPLTGTIGNIAYFETTKGAFKIGNFGQYFTENIENNSVAIGFANRASSNSAQ